RPGALAQGDAFAALVMDYARAPLVRVLEPELGNADPVVAAVVDHLTVANLVAGVAVHDRVRLDAHLPVALLSVNDAAESQPPAAGDLRLTALGLLLPPQGTVPGVGLVAHLDAPTGVAERYLGVGGIAGGFRLAGTLELDSVTVSANAGMQFDPNSNLDNLVSTDRFVASAGVGWLATDVVGLQLEAVAEPVLRAATAPGTGVPLEAVVSMRARSQDGPFLTVGLAGGITRGAGVPAYRAFLGGGFGQISASGGGDIDRLGQLRILDQCPDGLEVMNGWLDDDGCPDELGTLNLRAERRGRAMEVRATVTGPDGPSDQWIPVNGLALDAAPGTRWDVVVSDGCVSGAASAIALDGGRHVVVELQLAEAGSARIEVVDPEGVPVRDATIAWSSETPACVPDDVQEVDGRGIALVGLGIGTHEVLVAAPGYAIHRQSLTAVAGDEVSRRVVLQPSSVRLTGTAIEITEKVMFGSGNAVISGESHALLDDVASVIQAHAAVGRIEVAGHTDGRGSDELNLALSQRRADAVRDYLASRGVDLGRLLAVGYGAADPIESNRTPEGREANRRVEFRLVDKAAP
ncbi:MAG: OOP family OmpA-OmpF porin, partial [Myxococcota bacterium]